MPQLATVDYATGYRIGDNLLLRISGRKPSPCFVVSIELAPMDIFPPEFNATWAPDQQIRDDLTRFKQVLETGQVVRSEGSPEGPLASRLPRQRPAAPQA